MARVYPGAQVYDVEEKVRFILQGTTEGKYKDITDVKHNKSDTKLLRQNTGLVYIK